MVVLEMTRLTAGIAAYKHEQRLLLRILRKHKSLTPDQFDNIFGDFRTVLLPNGDTVLRRNKQRFRYFLVHDPKSFILDRFYCGAEWYHLAHIMADLGLLTIEDKIIKENKHVYRSHSQCDI